MKRSEQYPILSSVATPSLATILQERISRLGPLPFPQFMQSALYEPNLGYYAKNTTQTGRNGDFFTSVSVGPLFGEFLARHFLKKWKQLGSPTHWLLIECGAHDGTLALDILTAIQTLEPQALLGLQYTIPDPQPVLQSAQKETLRHFEKNVLFLETPTSLAENPLPGIAFGNELLDALPFHVIVWRSGSWKECFVDFIENAEPGHGQFQWSEKEIENSTLQAALAPLGHDFSEGYRTEIRPSLTFTDFFTPLLAALHPCHMLWIDYGFSREDYYNPTRTTGTLRTFSKHTAAENPLKHPGEIDITAHVDFTAVAESAQKLGAKTITLQPQGTWLTHTAHDWLLEQEGKLQPILIRQFQTLTHPAHLGRSFQIMEISWT